MSKNGERHIYGCSLNLRQVGDYQPKIVVFIFIMLSSFLLYGQNNDVFSEQNIDSVFVEYIKCIDSNIAIWGKKGQCKELFYAFTSPTDLKARLVWQHLDDKYIIGISHGVFF